jgi:DNA-binding SARP family transcriptional activator
VEFRVLGALEVRANGRPLVLGGPKQRVLLAVLLLHAGHVVPIERLVGVLWDAEPPRSAEPNVRTYICELRRLLNAEQPGRSSRIARLPDGYRLHVDPGELDVGAFEALAGEGRAALAAGDAAAAATLLGEALHLWRGRPAEDVPLGAGLKGAVAQLEEQRLVVLEDHVEARLRLGDGAGLVAELQTLVGAHPLRERLWGQLMCSLYRAGRQAEALRAYTDARAKLVEQFGLEPGAALQRLQQAILHQDPSLERLPPDQEASDAGSPACQLPPDIGDFTGRMALVERVTTLLARPCDGGAASPVAVVTGAPGVGKTTLATRIAHGLRPAFPGGQLHACLTAVSGDPRDPMELLGELLSSLGVEDSAIPAGLHARAALYRARLADRRVLLLLDEAAGAAQVRWLLPGTPGCAVLVTSRDRFADLPGATVVDLDVMDDAEATELLRRTAGADRVAAEPNATQRIVRACGQLPLAVRIAGARLAVRPAWPLRELADRLDGERNRLDELQAGELAVRASFERSYRSLDLAARRAFRLLAVIDAAAVAGWVVAALLGRSDADREVETLVARSLLRPVGRDQVGQVRYRLQGLLHAYATELLAAESPRVRQAALSRALDAWLWLLEAANRRMRSAAVRPPPADAHLRCGLPTSLAARLIVQPAAWYEAERGNLVAAVGLAARAHRHDRAARLFLGLLPPFSADGRREDWERAGRVALEAVRDAGDAGLAARIELVVAQASTDGGHEQAERPHYAGPVPELYAAPITNEPNGAFGSR